MKQPFTLTLGIAALSAFSALAATTVFDFEAADAANALPYRTQNKTALEVVQRFATSGTNALRFTTAAWTNGLPEWPAFELKPTVHDWSDYDRLVVDITNPGEERYTFALFVSDHNVAIRDGLFHSFAVPSCGYARCVVPLAAFPDSVKRSDIATLHLFTERPHSDMTLFLDNFTLLKKGESLPEPPEAFVRQLSELSLRALDSADRSLVALSAATQPFCDTPAAKANAQAQLARIADRLKHLRADATANAPTLAKQEALQTELAGTSNRAERLLSTLRLQQSCAKSGLPADSMLVGAASSMEQLLPRGGAFELRTSREIRVRLARNEKESVQIAVLPADSALRGVAVRATDLTSANGAVFPCANIDCDVTGYVETHTRPPYGTPHIGWWPNPILNFLGPVDIAPGDLQSFWIRVRAPAGQAPGEYSGKLTVSAQNAPPVTLKLCVRVYDFVLPSVSPLPLAITFAPEDSPLAETQSAQTEWRKAADYPVNAWKKQKLRWADFLADYYITYDSLYHHGMPDFEVIDHLQQEGRLGVFNLGYWHYFDADDKARENWQKETLERLRAAYEQARSRDLVKHAYVYGCDEVVTDFFPRVEAAASLIKAACPGAPIMTTTYDHSFGMSSGIRSVDAFCPLTPKFDPAQAAAARAAGKQVWWYICCGPHHPYANLFIEYPAIEGRLLMGPMTAKMRPDGFLYYQISIWNSEKPITSGPFTDWNPRSWTTYHGDGAWTCVGPDGAPLPTQRLENFRDGLEDFAYFKTLEDLVNRRAAEPASAWFAEAKAALAVPETLVKSMTDYSRDPDALYAWRNRLAELIERGTRK